MEKSKTVNNEKMSYYKQKQMLKKTMEESKQKTSKLQVNYK